MAFYLIGSYINSIDDSTMQQLNAMSDPAANIIIKIYLYSISEILTLNYLLMMLLYLLTVILS